jgi:SAM-dependent methyltransferase
LEHDFSLHSGERVTGIQTDHVPNDHLERYRFAAQFLQKLTPPLVGADIFCGSGYGAEILASKLDAHLFAIDGSQEAIAQANHTYCNFNVLFAQKYFPFTLPNNLFDFVVSMESLEHVENGELFASMLASAIKPGGILIISAPNESVVSLPKNPYRWHFKHYEFEEVIALFCERGFDFIQRLGASCTIVNDAGKVVCGNYYSPISGELRENYNGDTITYVFERKVTKDGNQNEW